MNETLATILRKLRLSGLAETLDVRLHEASGNSLTHVEFLELILQDELLLRQQRQIARRVKAAKFRDLKSLEDFDWSFNPSVKKNEIYEMATGRFIGERRDVLFCAPPGTGKSWTLGKIRIALEEQGHNVRVVAPTHAAARLVEAETIHHFVAKYAMQGAF